MNYLSSKKLNDNFPHTAPQTPKPKGHLSQTTLSTTRGTITADTHSNPRVISHIAHAIFLARTSRDRSHIKLETL